MKSLPQHDQSSTRSIAYEASISADSDNRHEAGATKDHHEWTTDASAIEADHGWAPAVEDFWVNPPTLELLALKKLYRAGLRAQRSGRIKEALLVPLRIELERRGQAQRALDQHSERRQWQIVVAIGIAVGAAFLWALAISLGNSLR